MLIVVLEEVCRVKLSEGSEGSASVRKNKRAYRNTNNRRGSREFRDDIYSAKVVEGI